MKINYIELENIRSHKKTHIEFPNGSILLWGDVGAGKSTILYSIDYALFGSSTEIKGNSILRKGSSRGKIKLNFDVGKNNISIERTLEIKNGSVKDGECYITINGYREKIAPSSLKSRIFKLFGYPTSFKSLKKIVPFRYTVYVPQEKMKEILSTDPKDRLKLLRGFFDIEKYQTILENVQELKRKLNEKKKENEGKEKILSQSLEEIKKIMKEKTTLENKKKVLEEQIHNLEKKIDEFKELHRKYEDKREEHNKLTLELKDTQNQISSLKDKIAQMKNRLFSMIENSEYAKEYQEALNTLNLQKIKDLIKNLEDKNKELNREYEVIIKSKASLKEDIEEIKKKIKEYHSVKEEYTKIKERERSISLQVEREKKEIEEIKSKITELDFNMIKDKQSLSLYLEENQNKIKELEENITHLLQQESKLKGILEKKEEDMSKITSYNVCPFCKQEITERHKEHMKNEYLNYKNKLNNAIKEIKEKVDHISKEKYKLEEETKNINEKLNKINELEKIKEKNEIYLKQIEDKNKIITTLDEEKKKLSLMLSSLEEHINKNKNIEEEYNTISNKYEGLLQKENEIIRQKDKIDKEIALGKNMLYAFEEYISYSKEIEQKINKYQERESELLLQIENLKNKIYELKEKLSEEESLINKHKLLMKEFSQYQGQISILNNRLKELDKKKEELERINKEISQINELLEFITVYFTEGIKKIEQILLQKIRVEFGKVFKEWVNIMLQHEDFNVIIDENFYPIVYLEGYEIPYEHLSGGEKQSIALSYRLSLNKILNDLLQNPSTKDILILDEPTDGFSMEQIQNIRNILNYLNLKQLIIVSHENIMKDFVDHIIYIEKENGISKVIYNKDNE